jgi:hypothetical protein
LRNSCKELPLSAPETRWTNGSARERQSGRKRFISHHSLWDHIEDRWARCTAGPGFPWTHSGTHSHFFRGCWIVFNNNWHTLNGDLNNGRCLSEWSVSYVVIVWLILHSEIEKLRNWEIERLWDYEIMRLWDYAISTSQDRYLTRFLEV